MLVLIVVVAATVFAAFIASYQKQYQAEQAIDQQRSLESVKILSVKSFLENPHVALESNTLESLNFTLSSLAVNPATLTEISIDGNPLETYVASTLDLVTGMYVPICVTPNNASCPPSLVATSTPTLLVSPRAQFTINATVGDTAGPGKSSFYNSNIVMFSTEFVKLDVFTLLGNDFAQSFVPPTAVATVDPIQVYTGSGSGYVTQGLLDGTGSIQNGNDTIVSWNWNVSETGGGGAPGTFKLVAGEKAYFPFPQDNGSGMTPVRYIVELVVSNTAGLEGSTEFAESY